MIDVSRVNEGNAVEEVILLGKNLPVDKIAAKIRTIYYEVASLAGESVPRVYVRA